MSISNMLRRHSNFCYGYNPTFFQTGSLFDFEAGRPSEGENGDLIVGGGFGNFIAAVQGKGNVFKTTTMLSLLIKALGIYPDSNLIILDTEGSIVSDLMRLTKLSDKPGLEILKNIHPLRGGEYDISSFFELLTKIIDERERMDEDQLYVESPFVNLETKKKTRVRKPLFVLIDSFSEIGCKESQDIIDRDGLTGGKFNTIHLITGNKKSTLFQQLRMLSEKYEISVILSSQLGENFQLDPFAPKSKQLGEMKMNEKSKGTSSKYNFLVHVLLQILTATPYFSDAQKTETKYPYDQFTLPKDLFELHAKFVRTKVNMTGNDITKFVFSQRNGLSNDLTHLDYLKDSYYPSVNSSTKPVPYFGLTPANGSILASKLLPEIKFNRKQIRKLTEEKYEVSRALEICSHLHYVQTNWSEYIRDRYPNFITPDMLRDHLESNASSIKVQDMLNSRSYWTYDKENKRPWMNIFKIMDLMKDVTPGVQSVVPVQLEKKKK